MGHEIDELTFISQLELNRDSPLSLVRQLYLALFEAISSGTLPEGTVLPATRVLASHLGIARNTVVAAYNQLADEAMVSSDGGRATRVIYSQQHINYSKKTLYTKPKTPSLSKRTPPAVRSGGFRALTPGEPDASLFPLRDWQRAMAKSARLPGTELGYRTEGQAKLQVSIARYLALFRSLVVEPSRIILTNSTRQSLLLAATMYADKGDTALVESPGYPGAVDAFTMQGLALCACEVDADGAQLAHVKTPAKLAYLTPCFHYPTGNQLSADRREAFLSLSAQRGTVLFEDDYDSEFRDQSQPRPALASQSDRCGACVLHAGTFSKIVFPAARVAWLVVPDAHKEVAWRCLRSLGGGHGVVAQTAVHELLESGAISKHLQRARHIYAQRRQVLMQCVDQSNLMNRVDVGGLTAVITLNKRCSIKKLESELIDAQFGAKALESFQWHKPRVQKTKSLVIGIGNVDSLGLPKTMTLLEDVIARC